MSERRELPIQASFGGGVMERLTPSVPYIPRVRHLPPADYAPFVQLDNSTPSLIVIRDGYTESLLISRRVAEELIALGLAHGE